MRAAGANFFWVLTGKSGVFLHRIVAGAPQACEFRPQRRGLLCDFPIRKSVPRDYIIKKQTRLRHGKHYTVLLLFLHAVHVLRSLRQCGFPTGETYKLRLLASVACGVCVQYSS